MSIVFLTLKNLEIDINIMAVSSNFKSLQGFEVLKSAILDFTSCNLKSDLKNINYIFGENN